MSNAYDILKLGMPLDFDNNSGMICHKKELNGNIYVNVAFDDEDDSVNYVIFKVIEDGNNIKFLEEADDEVNKELVSYWAAEDLDEYLKDKND